MSEASVGQRVLLAIGDPERERHLLAALREAGWTVAGRCLDGPTLTEQALAGNADAVLASPDLHRLTRDTLAAIRAAGTPVVLLVGMADAAAYAGLAFTLPAASDAAVLGAALREAVRRGATGVAPDFEAARGDQPHQGYRGNCEVIALVSGKGAPGTTTMAIGLAATLGAAGSRVLLLDGDFRGGSVGPYLDLDPRRGLAGLTVGPGEQPDAVPAEVQDGPGFAVLNGLERPETRERLTPERMTAAVVALQQRFDTIVIDAGETLGGVTAPAAAALIRSAERVLMTTTADLVGLWNARACLRFVTESLGVPPEAVSAVVNRCSGQGDYAVEEVERALAIRVIARIPDDPRAANRARLEQTPVTAVGGKAARAIEEMAARLAGLQRSGAGAAPNEARSRWRLRRQPAEWRR